MASHYALIVIITRFICNNAFYKIIRYIVRYQVFTIIFVIVIFIRIYIVICDIIHKYVSMVATRIYIILFDILKKTRYFKKLSIMRSFQGRGAHVFLCVCER